MSGLTLGRRITRLRKENRLLQKNLAAVLGVSIGTISNYEHDTHQPDFGVLIMIADYFSVSLDFLLGRTPYRHSVYCADKMDADFGPELSSFLEDWQKLSREEQGLYLLQLKSKERLVRERLELEAAEKPKKKKKERKTKFAAKYTAKQD